MILKKRNVNYQNKKMNTIHNTDKKYSTEDIYNKIIPKQSDNKYTEKQFKDLYKQKTELLKQNQTEAEKKEKIILINVLLLNLIILNKLIIIKTLLYLDQKMKIKKILTKI